MFLPGYSYHIIARGNERKNIFRDEIDRKKFIKIVGEAAEEFQFVVLSYVLMSNHYHFLIEIKLPNISQAMQLINASYTTYFNRKYKRSGHLLQGRFEAILVEHGQNLLYVTAYIHLNPARAGMVEQVIEYPWSSYRQYTGGVDKGIAVPEIILQRLSENRVEAVRKYEEYIKTTAMESPDNAKKRVYGEYIMGSESFVRGIKLLLKGKKLSQGIAGRKKLRKVYDENLITEAVKKHYETGDELLYNKSRWEKGKSVLMYLLKRDGGMTFAAIARKLGDRDSSGVGRMYKKMIIENNRETDIKKDIREIEKSYVKK
jgi:REP element-mobilizing transposase RayT